MGIDTINSLGSGCGGTPCLEMRCQCFGCGWENINAIELDVTIANVTSGTSSGCHTLWNRTHIWRSGPKYQQPCEFWTEGGFVGATKWNDNLDVHIGRRASGLTPIYFEVLPFSGTGTRSFGVGPFSQVTQAEIQDALERLCRGEEITLIGNRAYTFNPAWACNFTNATCTVRL